MKIDVTYIPLFLFEPPQFSMTYYTTKSVQYWVSISFQPALRSQYSSYILLTNFRSPPYILRLSPATHAI